MLDWLRGEIESEPRAQISERHRVLIAAAAAAVLGDRIRIVEIRETAEPSRNGWARYGRIPAEAPRKTVRPRIKALVKPPRKEKKRETPNHARG
jgi:hypothetical protein